MTKQMKIEDPGYQPGFILRIRSTKNLRVYGGNSALHIVGGSGSLEGHRGWGETTAHPQNEVGISGANAGLQFRALGEA